METAINLNLKLIPYCINEHELCKIGLKLLNHIN